MSSPQGDDGPPGPRGPPGERVSSQLLTPGIFCKLMKHSLSCHTYVFFLQGEAGSPGQPGADGARGERGVPVGVTLLIEHHQAYVHSRLQTPILQDCPM